MSQKTPEAVSELQRALVLDPASAYNWADLGDAEMNTGHVDAASYCFRRAVEFGPRNPYILFRAANFHFQTANERETLQLLRTVLEEQGMGSYYEPAFLTYSRLGLPIEQLLEFGVPKSAPVANAFLRYWMDAPNIKASQATYSWIVKNSLATVQISCDYVSFLMRQAMLEEAAEAWRTFTLRDDPNYRTRNWVFDGGFQRTPTQSPLDWRIDKSDDVQITKSPSSGPSGQPALLVKFLGLENIDFHNVSQNVVLEPGRWILRAWVKTEALSTNKGVQVHLFDSRDTSKLDWRSDELRGTNNWSCVEKRFETGPIPKMIGIELARQPSRKFDNKISGTVLLGPVEIIHAD